MSMQEWTDKQLIDRWQAAKDEAAFRVLHDRRRPRIMQYVTGSLKGHFKCSADEIVQKVFKDLQAAEAGFHRDTSVEAWLFLTADRRTKNFLRDQHRQKRNVNRTVELSRLLVEQGKGDSEHGEMSSRENVRDEFVDHNTPDKLACQNELVARIRRLLDRLSDSHRQIMSLCFEGHTVESAGKALGLTPTVAKGRAQRAREALRKMIKEEGLADEFADGSADGREAVGTIWRSLLEKLPKQERDAAVKVWVERQSAEAAAEALAIPPTAVKHHLRAATERLRRMPELQKITELRELVAELGGLV